MKKILSVLLCVFLLLATGIFALAADNVGNNVVIGENEIVVPLYAPEMGHIYTEFTAPATATYTFTCTSEDGGIRVGGNDYDIPWLWKGESWEVHMDAGESVVINVYSPHSLEYDYAVTFTVETDSLEAAYADWYRLSLGENDVAVSAAYSYDGLPCVFFPEKTGIYRITTTDDNAYVMVDGQNLEGAGVSHEVMVLGGYPLEFMVATYSFDPDTISFTIEAVSTDNKELGLGDNHVFVALSNAVYGYECSFTATTAGVYVFTAVSENAMISVNGGSWLRVGESFEVTMGIDDTISIDVAEINGEEGSVVLNIQLKEAVVNHEYEAVVTEPSCVYEGYTTYTCKICGHSYQDDFVPATGIHDYRTETAYVEATCTEDGYVTMACACGETQNTVLPKTGHTEGAAVEENRKEATCTEDGSFDTVVYCQTCGAEISRETTKITAAGHKEAAAVKENEKAATCAQDGSYDLVVYCSVCKTELSRKTEVVKATGDHVFATETAHKEATCTEDGFITMACGCGETETTVLPKTGHNPGEAVKEKEVAVTCTTDGSYDTVVYCQTCGAEISRETTKITAAGHKEAAAVKENEVVASCNSDGSYDLVVYCSVCKTELSRKTETVKATGDHVFATETERKDPTCTEDGYAVMACGCGTTDTVVLPKTGHTAAEAVKENEVNATCKTDGSYDLVVYCQICQAEMNRESIVVSATGEHVYATETERKDATCTEVGYVIMACGCGETQTTELPITEHIAAEAVKENEVAATCTTEGSYDLVVKCVACGVEMSRQTETVAATGHSFGEWETVKEATATEDGSKKRVCACGEEETEVIPALGEPETKPTEPETKPTEPATKPTEPETKPTAPATKPSEPSIAPTTPATQPGDTDNEGGNLTTIIIIAVVVVAIAIVAFVVIKKKK